MPLVPGTLLGPYEIVAPIGADGMGEVYRARDTRIDHKIAIKILPARLSAHLARKQRFKREATAIGASATCESSGEDRCYQPVEEPGRVSSCGSIVF
jgi:serine/threonine protein kinase